MNNHLKTYELKIIIKEQKSKDLLVQLKEEVKSFLSHIGIDEFVEAQSFEDMALQNALGSFDQYDIYSPICIFKYEIEEINRIKNLIEIKFNKKIICEIKEHETKIWLEKWKDSFIPIITTKFYIFPPWIRSTIDNKIPLCIEPASAFGTGQHPTTMLCLNAIEDIYDKIETPDEMLDLGCGTGILAIAAKKLGFKHVMATDIDYDAVIACNHNAQINKVNIEVFHTSLLHISKSFDLICANILASVLHKMAADLANIVKNKGYIILSGILSEEAEETIKIFTQYDLKYISIKSQEDWVSIIFQRHKNEACF